MASVLMAVLTLGNFGIPPAAAGHQTAPTTTPLLVDNFTQDSQLNGSLWQVNGNNVVSAAKQTYTGTVVTPSTSFSSTRGLQMSGVTKAYELTGIGSLHSFLPPFIVNVTVMGTDSHGAAFLLVLTNGTATSWVAVDGYLNSSEGSAYGIGLDARSPGWTGWAYLGNLVSSPTLDLWYDITVAVSLSGVATVGVASGGSSLGTMQVNVGTGPFVLGLMQAENSPPIVGNNIADWATATVLPIPEAGTYDVTFSETGLPAGTSWSVTLNGTTETSVGSTLTFTEPNGTVPPAIHDIAGWHQSAMPYTGTVTVAGSTVLEPTLTFTQVVNPLTFTETGLPTGESWAVTLAGSGRSSTSGPITFSEPNGTYNYTLGGISGYTGSPMSGTVVVSGKPQNVNITFNPLPGPPAPMGFLGLPGNEGYYVMGGLIGIAVIGATLAAILRGRRSSLLPPKPHMGESSDWDP